MKYAIMSDVHANPRALEIALADARELGCEKFLFLGDITGYGYDVKTALNLVKDNFDVVLLGNHDSACVGRECPDDIHRNLNYKLDIRHRHELTPDELTWLDSQKYFSVVEGMALAHGDFTDPEGWNYVFEPVEAAVSLGTRKEALLFCGHTHHAEVWELTADMKFRSPTMGVIDYPAEKPESVVFKRKPGSRHLVNVGSVGYPRNDLCSTYVICDPNSDEFILRRLPFDFKEYLKNLHKSHVMLPLWLGQVLVTMKRAK